MCVCCLLKENNIFLSIFLFSLSEINHGLNLKVSVWAQKSGRELKIEKTGKVADNVRVC